MDVNEFISELPESEQTAIADEAAKLVKPKRKYTRKSTKPVQDAEAEEVVVAENAPVTPEIPTDELSEQEKSLIEGLQQAMNAKRPTVNALTGIPLVNTIGVYANRNWRRARTARLAHKAAHVPGKSLIKDGR